MIHRNGYAALVAFDNIRIVLNLPSRNPTQDSFFVGFHFLAPGIFHHGHKEVRSILIPEFNKAHLNCIVVDEEWTNY